MLTSKDRILTTHCGSLPRPAHLSDLLLRQEAGEPIDTEMLRRECADAVSRALEGQMQAGIDIVSDGEQPRVGFSMYIPLRMEGSAASLSHRRRAITMTFRCSRSNLTKSAAAAIVSPIRPKQSARSVIPGWRTPAPNTSSSRMLCVRSGGSPQRRS